MKIIGLTGPSGAGKTEVANILKNRGFFILDADKIYKARIFPDPGYIKELTQLFSEEILDERGNLDAKKLGAMVFADPEKLALLNRAAHRRVEEELFREIETHPGERAAVIDAPQLFESGLSEKCDFILSVLAPRETRIGRITARDKISREAAERRIAAQFSDDFFTERSDEVILNDGDAARLFDLALRAIQKMEQKIGERLEKNAEEA